MLDKYHQGTLTMILFLVHYKLENLAQCFQVSNPCSSLPFIATDNRKQPKCLSVILNNRTAGPLCLEFN